jgi:squalene-hopene/tetraprenyl-beta-curcumene cyclase
VQETALAVELLASCQPPESVKSRWVKSLGDGIAWLIGAVEREQLHEKWPIGFYFAKLWYYEDLYPLVFTVGAMRAAIQGRQKGNSGFRQESGIDGNLHSASSSMKRTR